eukprot:2251643-Rhodomonas_salina.3
MHTETQTGTCTETHTHKQIAPPQTCKVVSGTYVLEIGVALMLGMALQCEIKCWESDVSTLMMAQQVAYRLWSYTRAMRSPHGPTHTLSEVRYSPTNALGTVLYDPTRELCTEIG